MGMESYTEPVVPYESERVEDKAKAKFMAHASDAGRSEAAELREQGQDSAADIEDSHADIKEGWTAAGYDAHMEIKSMSDEDFEKAYQEVKAEKERTHNMSGAWTEDRAKLEGEADARYSSFFDEKRRRMQRK